MKEVKFTDRTREAPYQFKQCECALCVRNRKFYALFKLMEEKGLGEYTEFIQSTVDDLDDDAFELDWIQSRMSNEFVGPEEVVKEFGIPEDGMRKFLEKRREGK